MEKKNTKYWLGVLAVAISLGTAWAVRGQFGHEQGAAWAGGIGTLVLVLISGRKEWYNKVLPITLSAAFGWGVTGIISYGRVVGYGKSDNFGNAFYGLTMLFVIGGLFGLLGGGLTGLSLESSKSKKVNWGSVIVQMVAGAILVYGFLVKQLEVLMTPPRSEAWAMCLGAGLAMLWYMARKGFSSSLRLAVLTSLGAGFGFAFGNFLQIVGTVLEIKFNMWNVMEYSIGFFGGGALAFGVFSAKWPTEITIPNKRENRSAFIIVFALIPLVVFKESLQWGSLIEKFDRFSPSENIALVSSIGAFVLILVSILVLAVQNEKIKFNFSERNVFMLVVFYFVTYVAESFIVTGALAGNILLNHILYVVSLIAIFYLLSTVKVVDLKFDKFALTGKQWLGGFFIILVFLALLTFVAINIHGEMGGANERFL